VITVSDTRTLESDSGGELVVELLSAHGHPVVERRLVPDEERVIQGAVRAALAREDVEAVLLTGGTGIAERDVTPEALRPLFDREIPGFGELSLAGTSAGRVIAALPGSRGAIRLALEKLLLPELGHLLGEARKGRQERR
jgi:molybdenum cofactor biosynthesis protein B